jgi:hypothetical protein
MSYQFKLLQENQDSIQSNSQKKIVQEMIDIIPSEVTPIFGVESGVEAEQFLMVSHFEGMDKAIEVHFMVFICLLTLFDCGYCLDLMLIIMLQYTMVVQLL